MTEWYRNGPLGLEQGFTVGRRPSGDARSAWLTLAVDATGSLRPKKLGSEVVFGKTLRYGDLSAIDAAGRSLPVRLGLDGRTLLLRIDDKNARYPVQIDPFIQQGSKVTGSGESGTQHAFGWSVALSADGNTALVGDPSDNTYKGAAWVFTRSGTTWTQQGPKLTGAGALGVRQFGTSVALSADGNTALIGEFYSDGAGKAWVFERSGSTWTQQGPVLTAHEIGTAYFGDSVALSADGNTALVGGYGDNTYAGAAWLFTRSGSTWTGGQKLTANDEVAPTAFGASVALSADGNTALVGGYGDNHAWGAAWAFARSGSTWTQQGPKLTGGGETESTDCFGSSVALSADGNTALIGAPGCSLTGAPANGAAWGFSRTGSTWTQQGPMLTASDETQGDQFGHSVALSADGNTALIGSQLHDATIGAAWVFLRSDSTWAQQSPELTPSDAVGPAQFGSSVALSSDGSEAVIGGVHDGFPADTTDGAIWTYSFSATVADPPTNVAATAGDGQATIAFTPPDSNGGAPVSSYTVTASPGGATATGAGSPITVSGLTDGTSYTFTATATNSAGTSLASAASNAVTPTAPSSSSSSGGGAIPDLAVTLVAPAQVAPGGQAAVSLTVADMDGAMATGVHAIVTMPAGAVIDSSYSDRGPGCAKGAAAGTLDCDLDFLSGPLVAHVTIFLSLPTAGQATLTATVSDAQGDKNTADNTAAATVQVGTPTSTTPPLTKPRVTTSAKHTIEGTAKRDRINGTPVADLINARAGNDWINGGLGNDTINGGAGSDIIYGGPGNDLLYGGPGNDRIYAVDGHRDTIDCGAGHDIVYADKQDKVARNCEVVHRAH